MFDVIIIGAGQAGLSMGYHLLKQTNNFLIIDQSKQIGDSWKNRYDSLVLFTTREFSSLPGLQMKGDSQGFPTKNEVVEYLDLYARTFELPIQMETNVQSLEKQENTFLIKTNKEIMHSKQVIIATGPFQLPSIPSISKNLSNNVYQVHSSAYKNASQLLPGNAIVVGGGNSGAQIAVELSVSREVHLSISKDIRFLPLSFFGKSIFWWFKKLGILNATAESFIGKRIRGNGDPIFGNELKHLHLDQRIILHPRTIHCDQETFQFEDQQKIEVKNVIWATGFKSSYEWINISRVLDKTGNPVHSRGITQIEGLYFLGLPWQHKRGSALLLGVGEDAAYIANQLNF
jgi:putative flavoprotein involved in K+ transport